MNLPQYLRLCKQPHPSTSNNKVPVTNIIGRDLSNVRVDLIFLYGDSRRLIHVRLQVKGTETGKPNTRRNHVSVKRVKKS